MEVVHTQRRERLHLLPAGEHVVSVAEIMPNEFARDAGLIRRLAKHRVQPDRPRENRLVIEYPPAPQFRLHRLRRTLHQKLGEALLAKTGAFKLRNAAREIQTVRDPAQ